MLEAVKPKSCSSLTADNSSAMWSSVPSCDLMETTIWMMDSTFFVGRNEFCQAPAKSLQGWGVTLLVHLSGFFLLIGFSCCFSRCVLILYFHKLGKSENDKIGSSYHELHWCFVVVHTRVIEVTHAFALCNFAVFISL